MRLTGLISILAVVGQCLCHWENVNHHRRISLYKSYSKEENLININQISGNDNYVYIIQDADNLVTINCKLDGHSIDTVIVDGDKVEIPVNGKGTLEVDLIYDNLKAVPNKIEMNDLQNLMFEFNKVPYSLYQTDTYELELEGISKGRLVDNSLKIKGNKLTYQLDSIAPLSKDFSFLSYERNLPMKKVNTLKRNAWISHWGNKINFEEYYELTNNGAALKSGFSRVDWLRGGFNTKLGFAINQVEFILPSDSSEVFFTDLVGNVSTSVLTDDKLYIKPRFPIFGNWNYNFTIGWSNELSQFVNSLGEEYVIKVPILNNVHDVLYNDVELNILLPERAKLIDAQSSVKYESLSESSEYSFFDFSKGHTKISINYGKLVDESNGFVIVKYHYSLLDYYSKVIAVGGYLFVALIGYWLLQKIDVSVK